MESEGSILLIDPFNPNKIKMVIQMAVLRNLLLKISDGRCAIDHDACACLNYLSHK